MMLARSQSRDHVRTLDQESSLMLLLAARTKQWLGRRKADLMDLVMDISDAHERGEKAKALAAHARAQAERESGALEQEWRRLAALIQQERATRDADRRAERAAREQEMAQLFSQDYPAPARLDVHGGAPAGARALGGGAGAAEAGPGAGPSLDGQGVASPGVHFASHAQREQAITDAFQKISAATGYSSMEELVANLAGLQERNFARFKHLVDVQASLAALEREREALEAQAEAAEGAAGASVAAEAARGRAAQVRRQGCGDDS